MNIREVVFPPKKILVPVDFSEASEAAWKYAQSLGASLGAEVNGLYVKEWLAYGQYAPMMSSVQRELADLRERLGAGDEISSVYGMVEGTILSWGQSHDYNLVVMGTHGRAGLERLLRGSIAEAVVRSSKIPVLVARGGHQVWRSVIAPVNFEPYAMQALAVAGQVAQALGAQLTVVHVVDALLYGDAGALKEPKRGLAKAVASLPDGVRAACKPKSALLFGDPVGEIAAFAKSSDLIVLSGHHKGVLSELVLGTTTQRLLRHCETPLLVLPSIETPARERQPLRKSPQEARGHES